jgi:molybdenum cofactor cytidylyltransferase
MGYPKPLLRVDNETFIGRIVRAMLPVATRLIVVVGARADLVRAAVPSGPRIDIVMNPDFLRGQLSSIKAGMRALSPGTDAVLIHLVDHPLVRPATFHKLVEAYHETSYPIIIARYARRRGHPVIFRRAVFEELLAAPEGVGARAVVQADPARVHYVDVDDPAIGLDLDTPDDLARAGLPAPPAHARIPSM